MCFWRLPCNSSFKYDECCFSRKTVFRIVEVDIFFCTRTLFKEWLARFDIDYDPSAIIVWISESSIESHIVHIWQVVHLEPIFETRLRNWLFRESFHRNFWRYTWIYFVIVSQAFLLLYLYYLYIQINIYSTFSKIYHTRLINLKL